MTTTDKPLSHAERGRIGATRRWGEPRIVRIDALDPRVRAAVLALVHADQAAQKAATGLETVTADVEGTRDADHAA